MLSFVDDQWDTWEDDSSVVVFVDSVVVVVVVVVAVDSAVPRILLLHYSDVQVVAVFSARPEWRRRNNKWYIARARPMTMTPTENSKRTSCLDDDGGGGCVSSSWYYWENNNMWPSSGIR